MKKFALLLVAIAVVSMPCFSQVERLDGGPDVSRASHTKSLNLDHFWCYNVSEVSGVTTQFTFPVAATLTDQFQTASVEVGSPLNFCNPVQKTIGTVVTPIVNLSNHLTEYHLVTTATLPTPRTLIATNQFGATQLTVDTATSLMVPTQKDTLSFPTRLDHYLCYDVSNTASIDTAVSLTDQFQSQNITVEAPVKFCNPVQKTIAGQRTRRIQNAAAHLLCYNIRLPQSTNPVSKPILNQLEGATFTLTTTTMLCVPSTKTLP